MKIQIIDNRFNNDIAIAQRYPVLYWGEKITQSEAMPLLDYTFLIHFNISSYIMLFIGLLDGVNKRNFNNSLVGIIEDTLYTEINKDIN